MSKIQRYRAKIHEHNYEPQHATMCLSEDVEKLEATLAERDAEIERLRGLYKDMVDEEYKDGEIIKQLKAENAELKKILNMILGDAVKTMLENPTKMTMEEIKKAIEDAND